MSKKKKKRKERKRNHDLQDRNFCKVSPSLYLRTFGAFCHMEGKKYRASSGGCLGRVPVSGLGSAKEQTGK